MKENRTSKRRTQVFSQDYFNFAFIFAECQNTRRPTYHFSDYFIPKHEWLSSVLLVSFSNEIWYHAQ